MNNKLFSKFLVLALVVGVFGLVSANKVYALLTPSTTTTVDNVAPSFTTQTNESWTQAYVGSGVTPARAESSATYPTNEGTSVTFTATAHDNNADNYYLIVCDGAGVRANASSAPTCTGTAFCTSTSTASDAPASCAKSTTGLSSQTYNWYAYVCDHNAASSCSDISTTSQGGGAAEADANMTGSPFHVNHAPTFTAATITNSSDAAIVPGNTLKFSNTSDADTDSSTQDTINVYICPGETDMGGATTSFDFEAKKCYVGAVEVTPLCTVSAFNPATGNATCNDTQDIVDVPTAHATDYTVKYYVEDQHGFSAALESKDFTVTDVAPVLGSYTTTDTLTTLNAGNFEGLTRVVAMTDNNGDNDITALRFVFFEATAKTDACTADENDCYVFDAINPASPPAGCTISDRSTAGTGKTATGDDATLTLNCEFTVWYNATPTSNWEVSATATDGHGPTRDTNFADSTVDSTVPQVTGIGVDEGSIAYGALAAGGTSATGQTTTLQNMGNVICDSTVGGTTMTGPGTAIPISAQRFNQVAGTGSSFAYGDGITLLTSGGAGTQTAGCLDRQLAVRPDDHTTTSVDEAMWWKIMIPATQAAGAYTGMNTFSFISAASCTGGPF